MKKNFLVFTECLSAWEDANTDQRTWQTYYSNERKEVAEEVEDNKITINSKVLLKANKKEEQSDVEILEFLLFTRTKRSLEVMGREYNDSSGCSLWRSRGGEHEKEFIIYLFIAVAFILRIYLHFSEEIHEFEILLEFYFAELTFAPPL